MQITKMDIGTFDALLKSKTFLPKGTIGRVNSYGEDTHHVFIASGKSTLMDGRINTRTGEVTAVEISDDLLATAKRPAFTEATLAEYAKLEKN